MIKIELKRINVQAALSEETPCYTAELWGDGCKVATLSNHGHGGPDMVAIVPGCQSVVDAMEEQHKDEYGLEPVCHGLVWDHLDRKRFFAQMRRKVMFVRSGNCYTVSGKPDQRAIDFAVGKVGRAGVLNLMERESAWATYKALSPSE